jgi:hypothetical protein
MRGVLRLNPIGFNALLAKEVLVHERALRGYLSRFLKKVADIEWTLTVIHWLTS